MTSDRPGDDGVAPDDVVPKRVGPDGPPQLVEPPPTERVEVPDVELAEPEATQPSSVIESGIEPEPTQPSSVIGPDDGWPDVDPDAAPTGPSAVEFLSMVQLDPEAPRLPERREPGDRTGIDDLFGSESFRDYEGPVGPAAPPPVPAAPMSSTQRTLLWLTGCLVAVLALVVVFIIGTRIGPSSGADAVVTPSATPSVTASPTPTPTPVPTAPAAAGAQDWDALVGGECVETFPGPLAEEFTVVDCAAPHAAQLVYRALIGTGADDEVYPGVDALQSQVGIACSAPGVIDLAAAAQFSDLQVTGSFPATEEQWKEGPRDLFCFVQRSGTEPLTGTLQGPAQAASWAARTAEQAAIGAPAADPAG